MQNDLPGTLNIFNLAITFKAINYGKKCINNRWTALFGIAVVVRDFWERLRLPPFQQYKNSFG